MRIAATLMLALLCGCGPGQKAAAPRKPPAHGLVKTIVLPGDDGRVHVIEIGGKYEVSRCLVHVGSSGSQLTCLQAIEAALDHDSADR